MSLSLHHIFTSLQQFFTSLQRLFTSLQHSFYFPWPFFTSLHHLFTSRHQLFTFLHHFLIPFRLFFTSLQTFFYFPSPGFLLSFRLFWLPFTIFLLPFSIFFYFSTPFFVLLFVHFPPFSVFTSLQYFHTERLKQIRKVITKFKDSFDLSEKNVFKKDPLCFCFSKSCLHGLYDAFYVLAIIVVLYYGIVRYSSLSGNQVEDISTEETTVGCFSSLKMENVENIVRDKS